MRPLKRCSCFGFSLSLLLLGLLALQAIAQEYRIGPDDVLRISFWQQPDLNTVARVRQDGKLSLPILGEIVAVGLTIRELEEKIVKGISVYNKEISQARVEVVEYNSRKVFVTGEVYRPGKYTFEFIPNLWEVLREAGGPTERAMLSDISVIHAGEEAGKRTKVNLSQALEEGDFSRLPELKSGDTVIVPASPTEGAPASAEVLGRSVIFVYGQIVRPGVYPIDRESTLLHAITLAGGPTADADLQDVRVLLKQGTKTTVARVNLEKHLRLGDPADFPLRPGDTVVVPKKAGAWRAVWRGLTGMFAVTSGILGVLYVVDRLRE